jgi:hypothetical protein
VPYKTDSWGKKAKERSKKRLDYFKKYQLARAGHPETYIGLGHIGEQEALIILNESKRLSRKIDLEWHGKRVDIKTSLFHENGDWKGWKFWLKTQRGLCDFYLLICKDRNMNNSHLFLIPEKEIDKNHMVISLSKISFFEKYRLKGDEIYEAEKSDAVVRS